MRNHFNNAAALILLLLVTGCGFINEGLTGTFGGYTVKDGKVSYHSGLEGMGTKRSWQITEADAASFKAIDDEYAKDKNNAYYNGVIIPQSDGASFKVIERPYSADKARVFYGGMMLSDSPQTFKIIGRFEKGILSTDGKKIFQNGGPFTEGQINPANFEQIGKSEYFRDGKKVFTWEKTVEGADPQTFEALPGNREYYARDKDAVFYNGAKVEGCDVKTHEIIDDSYHRDSKNLFYGLRKISEDVDNFKKMTAEYSKDSKSVFWQTDVISNDAAAFISFPSGGFGGYGKDGKNVFRCGEKVKKVDRPSFTGLDHRYAKDKNNVYFSVECEDELSTVDGADPATFELTTGDGVDAKDKNNNYNFGTNRGPRK